MKPILTKSMKCRMLYILLSIFVGINVISCKKEKVMDTETFQKEKPNVIVLSERKSDEPMILSKRSLQKKAALGELPEVLDIRYYLGRSYNSHKTDIGNPEGVGFPVIDIEKLVKDYPAYYSAKYIGSAEATSFSFSDFDRYELKTNQSKTTTGGFGLNLGLFKFGSTKKFTSVFSTNILNEYKRMYGELNVLVKDASYQLLSSSNVTDLINEKYLSPIFFAELNNSPTAEFYNNFGGFVVTDFVSGGRANALFTGINNAESSIEAKESGMDISINASFSFKPLPKTDNISASFGIGNSNSRYVAESNNISEFTTSVKTFGGAYGFGSFTTPKSIDAVNVDLSGWVSSLNDKSKHVLIGINDNGLKSIEDFILEKNTKVRINNILSRGLAINTMPQSAFVEPHLEVVAVAEYCESCRPYTAGYRPFIYLVNRFKDVILLYEGKVQYNLNRYWLSDIIEAENLTLTPAMIDHLKKEVNQFLVAKPFYKNLKVTALDQTMERGTYTHFYAGGYGDEVVNMFDESKLKEYYNSYTKMTYLLDPESKKGYSYYDDYILGTYGIREFVNKMPALKIADFRELKNYTITGL